MYNSLSEYLRELDRLGELSTVNTPVDTIEEIAEISDRIFMNGHGNALLFSNTGTPFPVATNIFGSDRRIALALGQPSLDLLAHHIQSLADSVTSPKNSLWDKLAMLPFLADASRWLPRRTARRGRCQDVVYTGHEVNLDMLPVLKCWPADGGRFITLPLVHTVDYDSGSVNVGMYRIQIFSRDTAGLHWHQHKTGAKHFESYRRARKPMPVTICVGGDPIYSYVATAPMPDGLDEYLLAGMLRGQPVKLVKSLTNNIWVPADCDFVIEGFVDTLADKTIEGPFGDHTGFYSLCDLYPVLHVTAITHRRDAVWPATLVGIPPKEDFFISKATEKIFLTPIRLALLPELRDLYMPPQGVSHNMAIVSLAVRYPGHAKQALSAMWGAGQMMFNKYMIVAPEGTDIRDHNALAALLRGVDFSTAVVRSDGVLDVLDHAATHTGLGGKLGLDLTASRIAEPLPALQLLSAGNVLLWNDSLYPQWSVVVLFAEPQQEINVHEFIAANNVAKGIFVVLDSRAMHLAPEDWLWLALANTDPARDVLLSDNSIIADARTKIPGAAGYPVRFPNVTVASERTVALVDSRWNEYGLGEFVQSPSLRYRPLLRGDEAEVLL